jgi:hypothetical protein
MRRLPLLLVALLLLPVASARAAPGVPASVIARASAGGVVAVSWTAGNPAPPPGPLGGYYVYRQQLQRNGSWGTDTLAANVTCCVTYLDTGQKRLNTYRFHVASYDQSGASAKSADSSTNGSAVPAFTYDSPWNTQVTASAPFSPDHTPYLTDLGNTATLQVSGTKGNPTFGSPLYFGESVDSSTATVTGLNTNADAGETPCNQTWSPQLSYKWDGGAIPVPNGSAPPEAGSDGHLAIVNTARTREWDFWNANSATNSTIVTGDPGCPTADPNFPGGVIAQIDLVGQGYSSQGQNAARASGLPLTNTSVRGEEVYYGIRHAIGITTPGDVAGNGCNLNAGGTYHSPASHTDGCLNDTHIHYGDRIVLNASFAPTCTPTIGQANVIAALKIYGAFIVDRFGTTPEIDAFSPNDPASSTPGDPNYPNGFFAAASFNSQSALSSCGVSMDDFRLVTATG